MHEPQIEELITISPPELKVLEGESIFSVQKGSEDDQDTPHLFSEDPNERFNFTQGSLVLQRNSKSTSPQKGDTLSKTQHLPFARRHRSNLKGEKKLST